MKSKNKLKTVLAETEEIKKSGICLETALTKTDKTQVELVSSVFVSGQMRQIPEKTQNSKDLLKCLNCDSEMNLIENDTIWFCPLGCKSLKLKNKKD